MTNIVFFVSISHLIHSFMAALINFDFPGSAENLYQFEEAMKHEYNVIQLGMWKLLLRVYGTDPSEAVTVTDRNRLLTERDLPDLLKELRKHAAKWRDIGTHLRFHPGELDNIQARPLLLATAPESWLGAMLTEWLQRAPDDTRGSSSIELLTHALSQCGIVEPLL